MQDNDLIIYKNSDGNIVVDAIYKDKTLWLSQKGMSKVFDIGVPVVSKHLKNIFKENELDKNSVVSRMEITSDDGKKYSTEVYSLDAIIAVGNRINSKRTTEFRIWATKVLKKCRTKGFALNDKRFINGNKYDTKYFENDEYWKEHINKDLESDMWIDGYTKYFKTNNGNCLDLGCGIGQFSKRLMEYGYNVISADISKIALKKVNEFNNNTAKIDMRKKLPFSDNAFDLVFANLSIHYFSEQETKRLMSEIRRVLKDNGLFIGSVNGLEGYQAIKDTAQEIEKHYWFNKNKYIRLFDEEDLKEFLNIFEINRIEKRETVRFNHKKNYWIFICKK